MKDDEFNAGNNYIFEKWERLESERNTILRECEELSKSDNQNSDKFKKTFKEFLEKEEELKVFEDTNHKLLFANRK